LKVTVKYNQTGERRFYEEKIIGEKVTAKFELEAGTRGSGVQGIRKILEGAGAEYDETRGQGYTRWVFDEKKLSWRDRTAVVKTLKAERRKFFKRDPDMNMNLR